jgi:hypothetical protein
MIDGCPVRHCRKCRIWDLDGEIVAPGQGKMSGHRARD